MQRSPRSDVRGFSNSLFARGLCRLAQLVCRHPVWFVYPELLLAVLCLLYAVRALKFDMNRDHLIGPELKSQQVYLAFEREFPGEGSE